jgi:hypothetical protein
MELKELQATKLVCQKQIGLLEKRIRLIDILIKEKLREDEEKEKKRESEKEIKEVKEEKEEEREKEMVRHAGGRKRKHGRK